MSTLKANNDESACCELVPAENDEYYIHCMAEILDAYPKSGPPGHPTRLSQYLYIGNQDNADDAQLLSALDITHVLNMAGTRNFDLTRSPYKPESGIRSFLMMPAEDFEEFDILPYILEAIAFLSRAETSGGCAFVHCNYGVNRSGVVAAAYLMVSEHKPLLQVINELKAKRSLILSNVGFRRQLVRFARCRGLLDLVELRPSRRTPRLDPGDRTPRSVTPTNDKNKNDKTKDETEDETSAAESTETETVKEPSAENGETPPRNGYHVLSPAVTTSSDPLQNGLEHSNGTLKPRPRSSHRQRLLRDIDSTIEALSVRDVADITSTYYMAYRPRDDVERPPSPSAYLYERPRPSTYLPAIDYTPDQVSSGYAVLTSSSPFNVLNHAHSPDTEEYFAAASSLIGDKSAGFYRYADPPNAILEEYLQFKRAAAPTSQSAVPVLPVRAPLPPAAAQPFTSTVKPRSYYSRSSATGSSIMDNFEEANISSFLAERNSRRPIPLSRTRTDYAFPSLDHRRRSASSLDAIMALPRSYSAGKSASLVGGYKPSPEVGLLPESAYVGRWYAASLAAGRRYPPTIPAGHSSSYVTAMTSFDSDPVGRTIATRVTPAPGYGPRSGYARSRSVSRFM